MALQRASFWHGGALGVWLLAGVARRVVRWGWGRLVAVRVGQRDLVKLAGTQTRAIWRPLGHLGGEAHAQSASAWHAMIASLLVLLVFEDFGTQCFRAVFLRGTQRFRGAQ